MIPCFIIYFEQCNLMAIVLYDLPLDPIETYDLVY